MKLIFCIAYCSRPFLAYTCPVSPRGSDPVVVDPLPEDLVQDLLLLLPVVDAGGVRTQRPEIKQKKVVNFGILLLN